MDVEDGERGERAYHHGDLRRALTEAAQRLLESVGATALSLRAVAREAGVSPAAPYHHFKDKNELLDGVARHGWVKLSEQVASARGEGGLTGLGLAYVRFARENRALYELMYARIRGQDSLPHGKGGEAYDLIKKQVRLHIGQAASGLDLELATFAFWCLSHGLAEMRGFPRLEDLKSQIGGEDAFVRSVLEHMTVGDGQRRGAPEPSVAEVSSRAPLRETVFPGS
jgi:AcrR family transcriptional regulator